MTCVLLKKIKANSYNRDRDTRAYNSSVAMNFLTKTGNKFVEEMSFLNKVDIFNLMFALTVPLCCNQFLHEKRK